MNKRDFIADDILSKIYQNKYKTGEKMPTERELAVQYEVSRYTIREALKKLVNIGCIKIVQGSGIFVNESRYRSPLIYNSLTEKKFKDIQSKIIYLKKIKPDKNLEQIFDISGDDKKLWEYQRVRIVNYQKMQIETTRLPYSYFPDLNEEEIKKSVHDYVQECDYHISHFITTYTAVNVTKEEAALLNCKKGEAAMKIINRGILQNSKVFEFSEIINLDYSVSYFTPFNPYSHKYRKN
ncbi:GntR-family transcriptional regulator [Bacillus sp. NRRL B-14911]|uniref:GntR family transcriptional regulator n=1 Tax=Bacillus infantis NRRL B-14911 TaxID=1367477 RepID=U5LJE1_9BACI|nr:MULTISPECIES: GntR family transcriptional regulator [Bacillus]AGX06811.1 GntR family transcriptional regulator [Bacillus infantis NRRL B-14911]EAR67728.1 GntR-family transcriptional regulator [Bacillus sp. NRRL B-14911]